VYPSTDSPGIPSSAKVNEEANPRRQRRAMTEDELTELLAGASNNRTVVSGV
jgi:hypothetical protein